MVTMSTALISWEACVWRRAWNVTSGMSIGFHAFPYSIVLARRHDGDGTQFHEFRIRIGTRPEKSKWKSSSRTYGLRRASNVGCRAGRYHRHLVVRAPNLPRYRGWPSPAIHMPAAGGRQTKKRGAYDGYIEDLNFVVEEFDVRTL
jgi:hypothetical protein